VNSELARIWLLSVCLGSCVVWAPFACPQVPQKLEPDWTTAPDRWRLAPIDLSGEESAQVTYVTGKDCTGSAVTPQGATTQSGGGITSTTWNGLTIQAYPPGGPTPSTASTSGLGITGDSGYYDCDGDPLSTGGEQDATIASNAPYSPGNGSVNITWSVTEWSYQLGDDCSSCDSNPGGTSSVDAESSVVTPAASVTAWCF
jgi:hypothetical protein